MWLDGLSGKLRESSCPLHKCWDDGTYQHAQFCTWLLVWGFKLSSSCLHSKHLVIAPCSQLLFCCCCFGVFDKKVLVIKMRYSHTNHITCMPCKFQVFFFLNKKSYSSHSMGKRSISCTTSQRRKGKRAHFSHVHTQSSHLSCPPNRSSEQLTQSHSCLTCLPAFFRNMSKVQVLVLSYESG